MTGERKRRSGTVVVLPQHGDVLTLANNLEAEQLKSSDDPSLRRINGKAVHGSEGGFGHEGFENWGVGLHRGNAEGLDVVCQGGLDVFQSRLIGLPLAYDDTLDPQRVSHVAIFMLFDDDLERPHAFSFVMDPGYHRIGQGAKPWSGDARRSYRRRALRAAEALYHELGLGPLLDRMPAGLSQVLGDGSGL
jgi:hypothetical protein